MKGRDEKSYVAISTLLRSMTDLAIGSLDHEPSEVGPGLQHDEGLALHAKFCMVKGMTCIAKAAQHTHDMGDDGPVLVQREGEHVGCEPHVHVRQESLGVNLDADNFLQAPLGVVHLACACKLNPLCHVVAHL